jgi:hypothetical protein
MLACTGFDIAAIVGTRVIVVTVHRRSRLTSTIRTSIIQRATIMIIAGRGVIGINTVSRSKIARIICTNIAIVTMLGLPRSTSSVSTYIAYSASVSIGTR